MPRASARCYACPVAVAPIDPEHLRAYARRPWSDIERAKREYIADRYRADPSAHARSVERLREHMREVRPEWPTKDDLARDLADHVALKQKIDRAAAAFVRADERRR